MNRTILALILTALGAAALVLAWKHGQRNSWVGYIAGLLAAACSFGLAIVVGFILDDPRPGAVPTVVITFDPPTPFIPTGDTP